ncbi:MAG: cysteine--tRNA ligase [Ignavibacteria bacterium]|nr:cysteine--tRNA ligase [Ignavibacteria bacterium]MBT8381924.1 cysteine--tRNA ligase [Ignavibacteria bacterium]NNL21135.1 cysteine--tRNA ligase [Ignavibacteriaceae bacterium]
MLSFYNTLTKKNEEFKPINSPNVSMYICGPTVYDYFHVGNARTFVLADVIRKYLEYKGYNVKFVMNVTDIDDKIIKKANEEKNSTIDVATKYSIAFFEDLKNLRIKEATLYPKATDHIEDMINMIKTLVDKGFAYNVNGNVFFDVKRYKFYGKLSGKNIDELESGARVEINESKLQPLDFALWKKAKEGEPFWDSPWGKGRPGWHIECSAMGCKHLGETFDIHAGGNDLIFPHHENEIAQSEAATNKPFANYWIHFGFLNINKEKMSKSLGNFFTAREILEKFSPEAIRLFFLQAHYRGPLDFTDELLASAEKGLEKIKNLQDTIKNRLKKSNQKGVIPEFDFDSFEQKFNGVMDDDFNTPQAVSIIFDFIREINKAIAENNSIHIDFYKKINNFMEKIAGSVLGITKDKSLQTERDSLLEDKLIEILLDIRFKAKREKNYPLADEIRNKLVEVGITIKDTKDGTDYFRDN